MDRLTIFCDTRDFCRQFEPKLNRQLLAGGQRQRIKPGRLSKAEVMTIKIKKNMKNKFVSLFDKLLLRKRAIIESVNDQLKNISQIEYPRHRSVWNFYTNVVAGLIAYTYQEKKPNLQLRKDLVLA